MNNTQDFRLVLFGGLGNQLFQYAAALAISDGSRSCWLLESETCRVNSLGDLDLSDFQLGNLITPKRDIHFQTLRSRIYLILLKISSISSRGSFRSLVGKLLRKIVRLISLGKVHLSSGLGYDPRTLNIPKSRLYIGNFHTFRYAQLPKVQSSLRQLALKKQPSWLVALESESRSLPPVILHVRRGDYIGISELGFLTSDYFNKAFTELNKRMTINNIWLFSDDYDYAINVIPTEFRRFVKKIDYEPDNAAANLEAMRLGNGYILSNSSFSWWGAFLSIYPLAKVIAPQNYFRTHDNPRDFYPDSWFLVESR